jgi:hypothetical protein
MSAKPTDEGRREARAPRGRHFPARRGVIKGFEGKTPSPCPMLCVALRGVRASPALPAERRDKFVTPAGDFNGLGAVSRARRGGGAMLGNPARFGPSANTCVTYVAQRTHAD